MVESACSTGCSPRNPLLEEEADAALRAFAKGWTVTHLVPAGLSRPLLESEDEVAAGNHVGTIMYSAPEIFATSRLTKPGDVYAFGIMRET